MIAFLGMGLLGSNFVKAMRKRGLEVNVWNRTTEKATELEATGAKAFKEVTDAVRGATMVHVTLKDDATVNEVLANALPALQAGAVIIDHTTTTAAGAIQRTKEWKERGFVYQHAPVFMGPANALEGTGFMLVSGEEALLQQLEPHLAPMTGKLLHFGTEPGRAAGIKLVGNLFLVSMVSGLADALSLAKAQHVPVSDLTTLFGVWNPASNLTARLQKMAGGNYDQASWELDMSRKDTQLFIETGAALILTPSIAKVMDRLIAEGFGKKDWTVIGKDAAAR